MIDGERLRVVGALRESIGKADWEDFRGAAHGIADTIADTMKQLPQGLGAKCVVARASS